MRFYKDKQGLPYIYLLAGEVRAQHGHNAATEHGGEARIKQGTCACGKVPVETALVQTMRANYKGCTKKEVLKAKEVRHVQAMIGNSSEGDYFLVGQLRGHYSVPISVEL